MIPKKEETYCEIYYSVSGSPKRKAWPVAADPREDDAESLTLHLFRWVKNATFHGYRFGDPSLYEKQN